MVIGPRNRLLQRIQAYVLVGTIQTSSDQVWPGLTVIKSNISIEHKMNQALPLSSYLGNPYNGWALLRRTLVKCCNSSFSHTDFKDKEDFTASSPRLLRVIIYMAMRKTTSTNLFSRRFSDTYLVNEGRFPLSSMSTVFSWRLGFDRYHVVSANAIKVKGRRNYIVREKNGSRNRDPFHLTLSQCHVSKSRSTDPQNRSTGFACTCIEWRRGLYSMVPYQISSRGHQLHDKTRQALVIRLWWQSIPTGQHSKRRKHIEEKSKTKRQTTSTIRGRGSCSLLAHSRAETREPQHTI